MTSREKENKESGSYDFLSSLLPSHSTEMGNLSGVQSSYTQRDLVAREESKLDVVGQNATKESNCSKKWRALKTYSGSPSSLYLSTNQHKHVRKLSTFKEKKCPTGRKE